MFVATELVDGGTLKILLAVASMTRSASAERMLPELEKLFESTVFLIISLIFEFGGFLLSSGTLCSNFAKRFPSGIEVKLSGIRP